RPATAASTCGPNRAQARAIAGSPRPASAPSRARWLRGQLPGRGDARPPRASSPCSLRWSTQPGQPSRSWRSAPHTAAGFSWGSWLGGTTPQAVAALLGGGELADLLARGGMVVGIPATGTGYTAQDFNVAWAACRRRR